MDIHPEQNHERYEISQVNRGCRRVYTDICPDAFLGHEIVKIGAITGIESAKGADAAETLIDPAICPT